MPLLGLNGDRDSEIFSGEEEIWRAYKEFLHFSLLLLSFHTLNSLDMPSFSFLE